MKEIDTNFIEVLRYIGKTCNYSNCLHCLFKNDDGCVFFNRPFEWDTAYLTDKFIKL